MADLKRNVDPKSEFVVCEMLGGYVMNTVVRLEWVCTRLSCRQVGTTQKNIRVIAILVIASTITLKQCTATVFHVEGDWLQIKGIVCDAFKLKLCQQPKSSDFSQFSF